MFRLVGLLCAVTVMFPILANCEETTISAEKREITVKEGEALVRRALDRSGAISLPGFNVVYWEHSSTPRFYFLTGVWDNNGEGSGVTGNYLVDRRTGDVWNAALCEELQSRALEQLKAEIRERIGLSESNYKKLRIDSPMC